MPIVVGMFLAIIFAVLVILYERRRPKIERPIPSNLPSDIRKSDSPSSSNIHSLNNTEKYEINSVTNEKINPCYSKIERSTPSTISSDTLKSESSSSSNIYPLNNTEKDESSSVTNEPVSPYYVQLKTCGQTAYCTRYGTSKCPIYGGGTYSVSLGCFSPKTSGYGAPVKGHFRRSRSGKSYWVKPHNRSRRF